MVGWQFIIFFLILSLWISLGNDTAGYYSILVILGNSWSLVILVFSIVICPKTKLYEVGMVKKLNLKLVINLIHLIVLGICFKKWQIRFQMQFWVIKLNLITNGQGSQNLKITLLKRPLFSLISIPEVGLWKAPNLNQSNLKAIFILLLI